MGGGGVGGVVGASLVLLLLLLVCLICWFMGLFVYVMRFIEILSCLLELF